MHNVYQKFLTNKWHMSESANQLMYCLSLPRTLLPVEVLVPGVNSLSKYVVFLVIYRSVFAKTIQLSQQYIHLLSRL